MKDGWDSGLIGCHFVPCELRGVVVRLAMLKGKNPGMLSASTIFRSWANYVGKMPCCYMM